MPFTGPTDYGNAPPGTRVAFTLFLTGLDNVNLTLPMDSDNDHQVIVASSDNIYHLPPNTYVARSTALWSGLCLQKGGDVVAASGLTIWTSTYGLDSTHLR